MSREIGGPARPSGFPLGPWKRRRFEIPRRPVAVIVGAVLLTVAAGLPASGYPRPGRTERTSLATDGGEPDGNSARPRISADGRYVVFYGRATNLVSGDTSDRSDIFVYDRETGVTGRASVAPDGSEANGSSTFPDISADGRRVAFYSDASNLVPGDTNGFADVFVLDRETGATERVSVASDGTQAVAGSFRPTVSADGRRVAFYSAASNLVPGDTNGFADVFVHDLQTGVTERVSVASSGDEGNSASFDMALSADGRYVAFESNASNLVPGDTNLGADVFVHDRETGTTERVSVASGGVEGDGGSFSPAISADGRSVGFQSGAPNLVPADANGVVDTFVHDRETGATERVSIASDGSERINASVDPPTLSADGRYVAFESLATDMGAADENEDFDVFVHDRATGVTDLVSVGTTGGAATNGGDAAHPVGWHGQDGSFNNAISADGRHVAFLSWATDLVPGQTESCAFGPCANVFVRDHGPGTGLGDLEVVEASDSLAVSGWATFSGELLASASDPSDDGPSSEEAGELTGASLIHRPEREDLLVRLRLASVPGRRCAGTLCEEGGGASGVLAPGLLHRPAVYGMGFEVEGMTFEVRARSGSAVRLEAQTVSEDPPRFALYRCDPECTEQATLTGGIGTRGPEVSISLPLSAVGASQGAALTAVRAFTSREAGTLDPQETLDDVDLPDATISAARTWLAIAPAGTPGGEVAFDTEAVLDQGFFAGSLDIASLPAGDYAVWARSCLGETCGMDSRPITLE